MPFFNRIGAFYVGQYNAEEFYLMSIEEQNNQVNETLESRLNQLNEAISAHEKALLKMRVLRDVTHCYLEEKNELPNGFVDGTWNYYIAVMKWEGKWRLCHSWWSPYPDIEEAPHEDWKPLADCSVVDRLRAAPHLGELRAKIVEEKMEMIPEVEAAIATLAKSLQLTEEAL